MLETGDHIELKDQCLDLEHEWDKLFIWMMNYIKNVSLEDLKAMDTFRFYGLVRQAERIQRRELKEKKQARRHR